MSCPYLRHLDPRRPEQADDEQFGCGARPSPESDLPLDSSTQKYLCNDDELFPFCRHYRRAESSSSSKGEPDTSARALFARQLVWEERR
jgi:hypothetical protein